MSGRLNGLRTAFAMFSIFPVRAAEWTENTMRYALCFFPCVGIALGAAGYGWITVCTVLKFPLFLNAAILCALPVILTGGVHMDGFIDTADALGSHLSKERRLEILKDPRAGAFGVMFCCIYFALYAGFAMLLLEYPKYAGVFCISLVLSRALASLATVFIPSARENGLSRTFSSSADKKSVATASAIWIFAFIAGGWFLGGIAVFVCVGAALALFFGCRRLFLRDFGGITGDLAGAMICACELLALAACGICAYAGV